MSLSDEKIEPSFSSWCRSAKTVGQIAVVGDRNRAMTAIDRQRLRVLDVTSAGGRVADVSDGAASRQLVDLIGRKDVLNEAHPAVHEELLAVARNDARGFLPSVLQRVQAEIGQIRGFIGPKHAKHAALIMKMIVVRPPHRAFIAPRPPCVHDSRMPLVRACARTRGLRCRGY